jgi:Zn-dependent protease/CBS domain-containing protein
MTPVQTAGISGNSTTFQPSTAGTVRLFSILGVPVRLHFTFILFAIFAVVSALGGAPSDMSYAVFVLGSAISVLLHELGHAAMAARFRVRIVEIVMFPIGGLPRMEPILRPSMEIWIAAAGPLVNLALAASIFCYMTAMRIAPHISVEDLMHPNSKNVWGLLLYGNVMIASFNLLPAYPMDGGRILRALLSYGWPNDRATHMAAWMGRMLAMGMGLYGLLGSSFILVFFALFIYLGAAQESIAVLGRSLSHGVSAGSVIITKFQTLDHGCTIREAANLMFSTTQQDFPVMHGDQVVGLFGRKLLTRALASEGLEAYLAGVMERDLLVLNPNADLAEILPLMAHGGRCALVTEEGKPDGKLLGLLTTEQVSEFLVLRRFGLEPASLASPQPAGA